MQSSVLGKTADDTRAVLLWDEFGWGVDGRTASLVVATVAVTAGILRAFGWSG